MKINEPLAATVAEATRGDLDAIDTLLRSIQPGIYNLAARMLSNRDDAADATQEILLRIVTHLGSYRGEAAFSTWVFRVARNHLLTAATRVREAPQVSLDALRARLGDGLAFAQGADLDGLATTPSLTPEDKLEARQIAIGCTQGMLMALDRPQRLAYLLDIVFGLSSDAAAQVLEITAAAYRQRLARARAAIEGFAASNCGLVSDAAACRCARQLPAVRFAAAKTAPIAIPGLRLSTASEWAAAERQLDAIVRMSDSAAIFRAHPDYQAPEAMIEAIRTVLSREASPGADHLPKLQ